MEKRNATWTRTIKFTLPMWFQSRQKLDVGKCYENKEDKKWKRYLQLGSGRTLLTSIMLQVVGNSS